MKTQNGISRPTPSMCQTPMERAYYVASIKSKRILFVQSHVMGCDSGYHSNSGVDSSNRHIPRVDLSGVLDAVRNHTDPGSNRGHLTLFFKVAIL